jgi:hypothetical protein
MSRKELYDKVRELGLADAIKKKYGDNFTRVSNANLEACISSCYDKNTAKEKKAAKPASVVPAKTCREAFIKLISILQSKRMITAKEGEEVAKLL